MAKNGKNAYDKGFCEKYDYAKKHGVAMTIFKAIPLSHETMKVEKELTHILL